MADQKPYNNAFPVIFNDGHATHIKEGMALRDYFAGQALVAAIAAVSQSDILNMSSSMREFRANISANAYHFADAMIAEREKSCPI